MSEADRPWGFMVGEIFVEVPKGPLLAGGHEGPPPFDVRLPSGQVRTIVTKPPPKPELNA